MSRPNSYSLAQARTARYREEFDSKNEVIGGENVLLNQQCFAASFVGSAGAKKARHSEGRWYELISISRAAPGGRRVWLLRVASSCSMNVDFASGWASDANGAARLHKEVC